jgi:hypothetical protein
MRGMCSCISSPSKEVPDAGHHPTCPALAARGNHVQASCLNDRNRGRTNRSRPRWRCSLATDGTIASCNGIIGIERRYRVYGVPKDVCISLCQNGHRILPFEHEHFVRSAYADQACLPNRRPR